MKLMLIDNFHGTFHRLWSVRLGIIATVCSGIEVALPMLESVIPHGVFGVISFVFTVAALIARAVSQPKLATA